VRDYRRFQRAGCEPTYGRRLIIRRHKETARVLDLNPIEHPVAARISSRCYFPTSNLSFNRALIARRRSHPGDIAPISPVGKMKICDRIVPLHSYWQDGLGRTLRQRSSKHRNEQLLKTVCIAGVRKYAMPHRRQEGVRVSHRGRFSKTLRCVRLTLRFLTRRPRQRGCRLCAISRPQLRDM